MSHDAVSLIHAKRHGEELSADAIGWLVRGHVDGGVSDAQMAALFMAGVINGFTVAEAVALADAYVASGEVIDLSDLRGPTVDKHSTGGVADNTTFVVGPILAACGMQLAKLSGRGLGHTGGTLDKLESIPGMRVDLTREEVAAQVERVGLAVAAATTDLVPADKKAYALRDVTGTVESEALIAASIMSKKIAGGASTVVLDVKVGGGAFLPSDQAADSLARLCVEIGRAHGRRTAAILTDMSQPLGTAIGNSLEVASAIEVLRGERGALREVSLEIAATSLTLATDGELGRAEAEAALDDGRALESFGAMIEAQGGDRRVVDDPDGILPVAPVVVPVTCGTAGTVASIACRHLGEISVRLGAGRLREGDDVDPAVGLRVRCRTGDVVESGQPLAEVHARDEASAAHAVEQVRACFEVGNSSAFVPALVRGRVS